MLFLGCSNGKIIENVRHLASRPKSLQSVTLSSKNTRSRGIVR
ncbi:unnamed protein product [Brassica rapa subsp. narinosa]